jgi:hypothetical protein
MIVLLTKYYLGDQIKTKIGGIYDMYGEDKVGICFSGENPGQKAASNQFDRNQLGGNGLGLYGLG